MDDSYISYSLKELFERLESRLADIERKLDRDHDELEQRVSRLERFTSRFLPTSVIVVLLMVIGLITDLFVRLHT